MKGKYIRISGLLLALALLVTLVPACGNGDEETQLTPTPPTSGLPDFHIEVSNPDHVTWELSWVTIWVDCELDERYKPIDVDSATIGVSFPEIKDAMNVEYYSSSMDSYHKYVPGDLVSRRYGHESKTTAQYPVIEAYKSGWAQSPEHENLAIRVRPENSGTFTFYVKVYGHITINSTSAFIFEPTTGTMDQQLEYVEVHSFEVGVTEQ